MKVATILTILVAAALTSPIHAGPPATPSSTSSGVGSHTFTLPDEDAAFFESRVVKFNQTEAAAMAAQYDEVVNGVSPLRRSNGVQVAAVSKDIIPFCVGYAKNPVRVRVFRNKMSCDSNGFSTLYIFTAYIKKDAYLSPQPMCSGISKDGKRSMFFSGKTTCAGGEWKQDFAFFESAKINTRVEMFQAANPHRMLLYPGYNGGAHGWQKAYDLKYFSFYRRSTDSEMHTFKGDYIGHLQVHKKIKKITAPADVATKRCATLLIAHTIHRLIPNSNGYNHPGKDLPGYSADAFDAKCTNLILSSSIGVKRVFVGGFGSIEVNIGKNTYAAISLKAGDVFHVELTRLALHESMRSGQPVMVSQNTQNQDQSCIAYIQGNAYTVGDVAIWNAPI
ncbi:hypothetical protein EC957_002027 [Mortierella hygrophila]|uniref:Uncharacterized protein n=1 Tax=Mortierella hygrophila TaxID=979708 RepID=A0A9P6FGA8_9FUNG|nr:hypothetical protein EC957_002027 [Mortierella hygrophila]